MFRQRKKTSFIVFSLSFALGGLATLIDFRFDQSDSETSLVAEERMVPGYVYRSSPPSRNTLCSEAKPEVEYRSSEVLKAEISALSERVRRLEAEFFREKERTKRSGSDKDPPILDPKVVKLEADILELKVQIETRRAYIELRKRLGESGSTRYQDLLYREHCTSY